MLVIPYWNDPLLKTSRKNTGYIFLGKKRLSAHHAAHSLPSPSHRNGALVHWFFSGWVTTYFVLHTLTKCSLQIRYYTIFLVMFDTIETHLFSSPDIMTQSLWAHRIFHIVCSDPTIRIVGAISLWSIEIMMQLRIYILFNRSKRVGFGT